MSLTAKQTGIRMQARIDAATKRVRDKLAELKTDVRLTYPDALVQINAPLALEQVALKNKIAALRWVLGEGEI